MKKKNAVLTKQRVNIKKSDGNFKIKHIGKKRIGTFEAVLSNYNKLSDIFVASDMTVEVLEVLLSAELVTRKRVSICKSIVARIITLQREHYYNTIEDACKDS